MELVTLDLEGSGAQDQDQEAILEIATIPIHGWQPVLDGAYHPLINPGRPIPHRPWISPGLTNTTLQHAPPLADVEPELAHRANGRHLVGQRASAWTGGCYTAGAGPSPPPVWLTPAASPGSCAETEETASAH